MKKKKPDRDWDSPSSRAWRHNGLGGSVMLSMRNMMAITEAETATPEAKAKAVEIYNSLHELKQLLTIRL